MRPYLKAFLVLATVYFATGIAPTSVTFAAEGGNEAAVLQADNSLQVALKKKDAKAAGSLLDQNFTWTNEAGLTRKNT